MLQLSQMFKYEIIANTMTMQECVKEFYAMSL